MPRERSLLVACGRSGACGWFVGRACTLAGGGVSYGAS